MTTAADTDPAHRPRKLDKAVTAELAPLKMERAVFTTEFAPERRPEGAMRCISRGHQPRCAVRAAEQDRIGR